MATLTEMQEALASLTELAVGINDGMDAVLAKIAELQGQSVPVTQEQLDELFATASAVKTELSEAAAEVETAKA